MYRPRSLTYIIGAFLVVLSIYTFFSLSSSPRLKTVTPLGNSNPNNEYPETYHTPTKANDPPYATRESAETLRNHETATPTTHPKVAPKSHRVDDLIIEADVHFQKVLSKRTYTLEKAAAAYRERRGRHPPPGFDLWYQYATKNEAVIVEDFFDQIYHDLNPFWAIEPPMIRAQARDLGMGAEIQGGKVVKTADWFWHEIWGRMIETFAEHLPDMFVSMNPMDESRLLVRWEKMNEFMNKANGEKSIVDPEKVVREVKGWTLQGVDEGFKAPDANWVGFNPYNYARRACSPDSPARQISSVLSPDEVLGYRNMSNPKVDVDRYFDNDFVSNYTEATDFCSDATIGGLHGALMLPLTCQNSEVLMPMFGGSKFHVNNEILLPAPMYWNGEKRFGGDGGDSVRWSQKKDQSLWRGSATGGRSKPFTWYMFHRHRFVAMTNGTRYNHGDKDGHDLIFNGLLQETAIKTLRPEIQADFGDWLSSIHNVAFTDLVCDEPEPDGTCWYTNDEYEKAQGYGFAEQFGTKYLPDIDGNSFSGRYRGFLLSNSLPIKATIYREWHDSRLVAWKHFVPMNNRFSDYYKIIEYFMGDIARGIAGRDDEAERIATEGREWAEKVLRKVDMQIYVFRLLLEYGRLTDDNRLNVGWVNDLVGSAPTGSRSSSTDGPIEEPGA